MFAVKNKFISHYRFLTQRDSHQKDETYNKTVTKNCLKLSVIRYWLGYEEEKKNLKSILSLIQKKQNNQICTQTMVVKKPKLLLLTLLHNLGFVKKERNNQGLQYLLY